jgi:hypothetical protein
MTTSIVASMTVIHTPRAGEAAAGSPLPTALQPDRESEPTEVLFPEAKRRERHRRLRFGVVSALIAVTLAAVAYGASGSGGGRVAAPNGSTSGGAVVVPGTPSALSLASTGALYFIDNGRIEVLTHNHVHVVLSSLSGSAKLDASIAGLRGLSVTQHTIWFTASGRLYQASLSGHAVSSVSANPGATMLDATNAGIVVYTTSFGVYERLADGSNVQIEGGGKVNPDMQRGGMSATSIVVQPAGVALGPGGGVYVIDYARGESLDFVKDGTFYPVTSSGGAFHLGVIAPGQNGVIFGFEGWDFAEINGSTVKVLSPWPHVGGYFVTPDSIAVASPSTVYVAYSNYSSPKGASSGIVRVSLPSKISQKVAMKVVVTTR